jgi:hypothetical protein
MALTITWPSEANTGTIYVPKADTTLVAAGPPEIRSLDVDDFRNDVMTAYAAQPGPWAPVPFVHNGEITISGDIFARSVVFVDAYEIEFEDGQYTVKLTGANHNIADVRKANQVSLIIGNSFGLIRSPGVDQANVQAAMDAQGYTSARADWIDYIEEIAGMEGLLSGFPTTHVKPVYGTPGSRSYGTVSQTATVVDQDGTTVTLERDP